MSGLISRRHLLAALPAALAARRLLAQAPVPPIPVRKLTHAALLVSDVQRSVEFYQGLFGMPIQARQGSTVLLRIGPGPQFLSLAPAGGAPPRIAHFGLSVPGFDPDEVLRQLAAHGIPAATGGSGGSIVGARQARVVSRGDTRELFFGDPDGVVVQLQDTSYCGGTGPLGNGCGAIEPSPTPGLLALRDLSHFTVFVSDGQRSNAFYQGVFGLGVQSYQGPTAPVLGVGDRIQFLMFAGGGGGRRGGGPPTAAAINHACFNMEGFDRDRILKALENYGISPRPEGSFATPPMISYVSLRMPNRGGAEGGTPELYFTDPDGLLMQLQDVRYCGGGGYLGDICT
jgi:catechol 2,3-dioxygenase-like lactoylglutathione lyase family enzyme